MFLLKKYRNENGAVLVTGLMFLVLLTVLGTSAYIISTTDVKISANYKYAEEAFNQAEAGVQYGIGLVQNGLEADTYTLPTTTGSANAVALPSSSHGNYSFTLSSLEKTGNNAYKFTSTGSGPQGATSEIDVTFKMGAAINYAAFGDIKLEAYGGGGTSDPASVYSYDHREGAQPTDSNFVSTGEGDIATNGDGDSSTTEDIELKSGVEIDGDVVLGARGGVDADFENSKGASVSGTVETVGYIDPDPLNVGDTSFQDEFTFYESNANNDNSLATSTTSQDFTLNPTIGSSTGSVTLVGDSDGTNYYFNDIYLWTGEKLTIDVTSGPVNIYVKGTMQTKNSGEIKIVQPSSGNSNRVTINVTEPASGVAPNSTIVNLRQSSDINPDGLPSDFILKTDSDAQIWTHNSTGYTGLIYAPYGTVDFRADTTLTGAVWGKSLMMHNKLDIYYDVAMKDELVTDNAEMTSWRQVLN